MLGVEEGVGDVVEMTTTGVDFPHLCFTHPLNLYDTIVASGNDKRES
jgi:hypothetical protein